MGSDKLCIFIHLRAQVVPHMGDMWIGPWAIFAQYVDRAFVAAKMLLLMCYSVKFITVDRHVCCGVDMYYYSQTEIFML